MMERFASLQKAVAALAACAALCTPMLALADGPAPDARSLGTVEAILAYCAKVDPSSVDKYEQQLKTLVQGASDQVLAAVRDSDEYKKARASVNEFVSAVDEHNTKKVCAQAVATSR